MRITMIGHSTVLIEAAQRRILTDPYFGTWGNPAYRRIAPPFKTRGELKGVDLVLISHNHWDHTDRRFLRSLAGDVPVLAPRASAWLTRMKGAHNVLGLGKWERKDFGAISITAVPASHVAITRGFIVAAEGRNVYFAGDTYLGDFMKDIGEKYAVDVALLPVATFRIPMTMGEKSAVRAVEVLRPRTVIPIHLGIVPRSPLLRTSESAEGFAERVRNAGLEAKVEILHEGDSWEC